MLCFLVHEHILYLYFFLSLISFANFLYFEPEHIPACINLPLILYFIAFLYAPTMVLPA